MTIKTNDVIFLIGAGCSFDAKIPTTIEMIKRIEALVEEQRYNHLRSLYHYIKSAILYGDGIFGHYAIYFSIEKFVNVLAELEKKDSNIIYPFIANWNERLMALAGPNFEKIVELKNLITSRLVGWIKSPDNYQSAKYYSNFYDFQRQVEHPLRIFTLNYDLCFEQTIPNENPLALEQGFDTDFIWNNARFETDQTDTAAIYLYKLHGSIDWKRDRDKGNILIHSAHPEEEPDLIFGTNAKLQSIDPYLYYVFEFRKYSLLSKLIIIIGYSFADNYINNLIKQALDHNDERKILVVDFNSKGESSEIKKNVRGALSLKNDSKIEVYAKGAKEFLETTLKAQMISEFIIKGEEEIF